MNVLLCLKRVQPLMHGHPFSYMAHPRLHPFSAGWLHSKRLVFSTENTVTLCYETAQGVLSSLSLPVVSLPAETQYLLFFLVWFDHRRLKNTSYLYQGSHYMVGIGKIQRGARHLSKSVQKDYLSFSLSVYFSGW